MREAILILSLYAFSQAGIAQRAATKADTKIAFELTKTVKGEADITDTLVPASFLTGTPTIYTSDGGYVCGGNEYGDLGKAQHFNSGSETYLVEGVMLWVGANSVTDGNLKFAVYGFEGEPTTELSSMEVPFSQVTTTVTQVSGTTDFWYSVIFDSPVEVTGDFAVGVEFDGSATGFGLVSTSAGDGGQDAWEIWSDLTWWNFIDSWGLDIDQAIFPLISKKAAGDNLVIDGDFPVDGPITAPWGMWSENGGTAEVVDGVCVMAPAAVSDQWQLQVNQDSLTAANDSSYMLTFTAWADADRVFAIDFEDPNNSYNRYGDTYDADAVAGTSEWQVAVTTTPTVYTRYVTFKRIQENTNQLLNIMTSTALDKVYIDDISLVAMEAIPVQDVNVTFNVDMENPIYYECFTPGTDELYVTGSFNGWDMPGTGESVLMMDENKDEIYTATVVMPGYTEGIMYKYFKNASWDFGDNLGGDRPLTTGNIDITKDDQVWCHVGINDMDLNAVTLAPNPFNSEFVISNAEGVSKIVVTNLLGQAVMTVNEVTNQVVLSTEGLNQGIYFVTIIDNNKNRRTDRVVKQ